MPPRHAEELPETSLTPEAGSARPASPGGERPLAPKDEDEIYLARGAEVEPWRPVLQGDVFAGVPISGLPEYDLAMIVAHPCVMRNGVELVTRIQAVPVTPWQRISKRNWATAAGYRERLPLGRLRGGKDHFAAHLDAFGMVQAADLSLDRRIACLTNQGILWLQQRFIHSLSRAEVPRDTLEDGSLHALWEAELQEEWNARLVAPRVADGEELAAALSAGANDFDAFMRTPANDSLRHRLLDESRRPEVVRAVRHEIHARLAA